MSTKLGDDLMRVLKLDATGSNWVIYKDQFQWAIDARGLLEHVDGSAWEPTKPTPVGKKVATGEKVAMASSSESAGSGDFEVVGELTEQDEKKLEKWKEKC